MTGTIVDCKPGTRLWQCDECGFGFDAKHTEEDGSHSCPCCEVAQLRHAAHKLLTALAAKFGTIAPDAVSAARVQLAKAMMGG